MRRVHIPTIFIWVGIIFLPSCGRLINWAKPAFYQGEFLKKEVSIAARYIRSIIVYDQFTVNGHFDVLWLSTEVRTAYVNLYTQKHGKDTEFKKTLLRRQLEEVQHYISFYILSNKAVALEDKNSPWSVFLTINNVNYEPVELKHAEIDPEYQLLFCKRMNKFKNAYLVRFEAKNEDERLLITSQTPSLMLKFRSATKEACLAWPLTGSKVITDCPGVCKVEDYDPAKDNNGCNKKDDPCHWC